MATGFKISTGTDLDLLFLARSSAKIADVGFRNAGGVDLSNLFEPRGTATAIANTNFRNSAGTDFAQLFRDINVPLLTIAITAAMVTVQRQDNGTPAELHIDPDGNIYGRQGTTLTNNGAWINQPALAGNYASRLTVTSGTLASGSNGVWETINVRRSWSRGAAVGATQTVNYLFEIRRVADSVVMTSANGSMQCIRA